MKKIGPKTEELTIRLLEDRSLNRLRSVQGILKMAEKYGSERLESACSRALAFDDLSYRTIKRILVNNLDKEKIPAVSRLPFSGEEKRRPVFSRPWSDFFPDSVRPKEEMIATIKTIATESQGEREDEHTESIGTDA